MKRDLAQIVQDNPTEPEPEAPTTVKVKRGDTEYEMDTTNIGKRRKPMFVGTEKEVRVVDDVVFEMGRISAILEEQFSTWTKQNQQRVIDSLRDVTARIGGEA